MQDNKNNDKVENFFGYLFTLAVSVAMAAGSLTQAFGLKGWWTPTFLWVNGAIWVVMSVVAVVIFFRYLRFLFTGKQSVLAGSESLGEKS